MSTTPYVPRATGKEHTYPLVMFARAIKKNTAELDSKDLRQFIRWLWKVEPIKHKLCILPGARKGAQAYFSQRR